MQTDEIWQTQCKFPGQCLSAAHLPVPSLELILCRGTLSDFAGLRAMAEEKWGYVSVVNPLITPEFNFLTNFISLLYLQFVSEGRPILPAE